MGFEAFPLSQSTSLSSKSLQSSLDPPLLFHVFCFLGGTLGSDSPRLRAAGALVVDRVLQGGMVLRQDESYGGRGLSEREWGGGLSVMLAESDVGQRVECDIGRE